MRRMSVKWKITMWYTVFMTILVAGILWLLFSAGSSRVFSQTQLRLKDTVMGSFHEIEYDKGFLEFDEDLDDPGEGIYLSVYDGNGGLLYGRMPAGFQGADTLIMDEIQQAGSGRQTWYVYDYCQRIAGYGNLWIRGIATQSQAEAALRTVLNLAFVFLPFFVLCVALGGYSIIRKALAPLTAMTETAQKISRGSDLSQRIRLGAGEDEIHRLAHTFDHMMEKLEVSFENEKQFTSDVSHELRTPVSVILSQCEYAAREDVTFDERLGCIAVVREQAKKMSTLISQLLTLARADRGKETLNMELLNLSELAQVIAEEQREFALKKNITLEESISPIS